MLFLYVMKSSSSSDSFQIFKNKKMLIHSHTKTYGVMGLTYDVIPSLHGFHQDAYTDS